MYRVSTAQRVIAYNSEGTYDTDHVKSPFVIRESSSSYKMWYEGVDGSGISRILYATSTNGTSWTAHALAVNYNVQGTYDSDGVRDPWVIKESSSSYKMWYVGEDTNGYTRIMYATSTNGTSWTGHALAVDGYGDESYEFLTEPSVVKYSASSYAMWITSQEDSFSYRDIGRITSTDGTTWTFNPAICIATAEEGTADSDGVGGACVLYDLSDYKIRHDGEDSSAVKRILGIDEGSSTCPSGEDVEVYVDVETEGTYDTDHAASPSVADTAGEEQCWYAGYDGTHWNILYGEASEDPYIVSEFVLESEITVGEPDVDINCGFLFSGRVEVAKELSISADFVLGSEVEVQGGDNLNVYFVFGSNVFVATPYNTIGVDFVLSNSVTASSTKKAEIVNEFVLSGAVEVESPAPVFSANCDFVLRSRLITEAIKGKEIEANFALGAEIDTFSETQNMAAEASFIFGGTVQVGTDGATCSLPSYDSTRWT